MPTDCLVRLTSLDWFFANHRNCAGLTLFSATQTLRSRAIECNHAGNFSAALLAGTVGQRLGYHWIFYFVCLFAIASAFIVSVINPREIDHEVARGGEERETPGSNERQKKEPLSWLELLRRKDLLVFLASVVLFHFGNAAMLPIAGQVLAKTHPGADISALSACIICAQLVMVAVAAMVGWALRRGVGRKTIFLVAFAIHRYTCIVLAMVTVAYVMVSAKQFPLSLVALAGGGALFSGDRPPWLRPENAFPGLFLVLLLAW